MKREKKKKLNKKDRFKEVKKAPVPMHSAPLFIKNIYGIETITDSGIFQVGENIFSILYWRFFWRCFRQHFWSVCLVIRE